MHDGVVHAAYFTPTGARHAHRAAEGWVASPVASGDVEGFYG